MNKEQLTLIETKLDVIQEYFYIRTVIQGTSLSNLYWYLAKINNKIYAKISYLESGMED